MNWTKLLYVLIIVMLYIPMVFLGANVFFPKYTGSDSYYNYEKCAIPRPVLATNATDAERQAADYASEKCYQESRVEEQKWRDEKNAYEGWKYTYIALFNLVVLLIALFVTLKDSVMMGLFLASIGSTFGATLRYFDSRSKTGFIVLVVIFFVMIYFINRKKDMIMNLKAKKK